MKTFSIGATFKEATALMRQHRGQKMWQFFLIYVVFAIALFVLFGRNALLPSFIVTFIMTIWSLSYVRKGTFSYDNIFENLSLKRFAYFLFAMLLQMLYIAGGLLLLIVPGIAMMVRYAFVRYIAAEKELAPQAALRESKRITAGNRWKIFWFMILCLLINLLGLICLVVGLFYTVPLTQFARTILYKKLSE